MSVLIVDGYNIIHAWPALRAALATEPLREVRRRLIMALVSYGAVTGTAVTVVFDSGTRGGPVGDSEVVDGVTVRYGTANASADHVIERLAYDAARMGGAAGVMVATSDRLQRDLVAGMGVATIGALALEAEVARTAHENREEGGRRAGPAHFGNRLEGHLSDDVRRRLERLRRGLPDEGEGTGGAGG